RGWLDLQRYCVTACDALGGDFAHVGSALRGALRSLLRDLPELPLATMDDDASTANAETQAWLRAEGMLEGEPAPEVVVTPQRFRRNAAEQAQELVRAQQPQKAIELLLREAEQERSARDRFLRRCQATGIMVDAGLEAVAVPILQQLAEQVQHHVLEDWEDGETVASVLGLLYQCLQKLGTGDSATMQDLYLRVCRLDAMRGMKLQPQ
ncbi:MAG TPA: type VI secretion system domain-containing protein, partial [Longimicrobiales bacterium]